MFDGEETTENKQCNICAERCGRDCAAEAGNVHVCEQCEKRIEEALRTLDEKHDVNVQEDLAPGVFEYSVYEGKPWNSTRFKVMFILGLFAVTGIISFFYTFYKIIYTYDIARWVTFVAMLAYILIMFKYPSGMTVFIGVDKRGISRTRSLFEYKKHDELLWGDTEAVFFHLGEMNPKKDFLSIRGLIRETMKIGKKTRTKNWHGKIRILRAADEFDKVCGFVLSVCKIKNVPWTEE